MEENPKTNFEQRKSRFSQSAARLQRRYNQMAIVRVGVFLAAIVIGILLINVDQTGLLAAFIAVFIAAFGMLVNYHNKIKFRKNLESELSNINQEELLRLQHALKQFDEGSDFLDEAHPYVYDLDIFGRNSLFQLLNRTGTNTGRNALAEWMKKPANRQEILERQEAVAELKTQIGWRQKLEAYGRLGKTKAENFDLLQTWLEEKDQVRSNRLLLVFKWIGTAVSLVILCLLAMNVVTYHLLVVWLVVNGLFLVRTFNYAKDTHEKTGAGLGVLLAYQHAMEMIEAGGFKAAMLKKLQSNLTVEGASASSQIGKLQSILSHFDNRANLLYAVFNIFFLTDLWLLAWAESWRARLKDDLMNWFLTVGEFEAINSLSGFSYAHPQFVVPEISGDAFIFQGLGVGHPLIPANVRVANDFELKGQGQIALITGSNMAGKSTFLRTVGINVVLGLMGAPVCAAKLTLSIVLPYTSMRTKDNLEESVSSFYAELLRIRGLLETIDRGEQVLFLLDEILKGTNSHDRHKGAAALLAQLQEQHAFGLVSTHDLALGERVQSTGKMANFSFNSHFEGDEILFDYKLQPGLCRSFNASQLMAKMGIRVKT